MTEQWAWHPLRAAREWRAAWALGSRLAEAARAISTSSLWSRGLLEPRYLTLTVWMGSMALWAMRWTPCPPRSDRAFRAFRRAAAEQPMSSEVLPVTMEPSGSAMAMAG